MERDTPANHSGITSELYFLIAKFLAAGPHRETAEVLRRELESSNTLPTRLDWLGNEHGQSFEELERRYPHIGPSHLLEICRRIGPILDREIPPRVPGIQSLLGAGSQSLLRSSATNAVLNRSAVRYAIRRQGCPLADSVGPTKPHNLVLVLQGRECSGPTPRRLAVPTQLYAKQQLFCRRLGHLSAVYCLLFDRIGTHIITGADDLLVKIWSAVDGRLLTTLRGASAEITDIAVNHENTLLAAGCMDKILRVWCLQTTAPIAVLLGHTGMITAVHFCPLARRDISYLMSTSTDGSVAFWNYCRGMSGKYVFQPKPMSFHERMRPGQAQMICASYSPGGSFLAAGSADHHVRVYMMLGDEGPHRILETEAHTDRVDSIQWANQGLRFVSGSKDGTAHVWKYERQQWTSIRLLMSTHLPGYPVVDDPKLKVKVSMVSWDLTDDLVITAVNDNTIKVWNSRTGILRQELRGHRGEVFVLEAHPLDKHVLLSAGHDGLIIIWDICTGGIIKKFENTLEDQGHGAVFDAKWSPDGLMMAATDSHGHILMFGFGEPSEQLKKIPTELFFHTDYRPLIRDSAFHVLDEQTQTAPHLMPPPFLVDVDGNPYPPGLQRLVPGREGCKGEQLVPNILVGAGGLLEVIEGLPEPRSQINEMIQALAHRQYGDGGGGAGGGVRPAVVSPRAAHRVGMRRNGDVEGVRQSSGNWQRENGPASWNKRKLLQPVERCKLEAVTLFLAEVAGNEMAEYRRESRRSAPAQATAAVGKSKAGKRAARHGYRTRAAREEQRQESDEDETTEQSAAAATASDDDSTAREEDLGSSSDSDTSSEYSDWVADAGVNLEPPKRSKRRPAPKRPPTPDSDRPQRNPLRPTRLEELPEIYRPSDWLSEVVPRKAPYYPQMGDEVCYFRQGHQLYLDAVRQKKVYDVHPRSQPWLRREIRHCELVKVIGIKYELRPPRLCCLKLALMDTAGRLTGEDFTVKYHDMPDVIDFLVLRQTYDLAVERSWDVGDQFRCMIGDGWWTGVVESRSPADADFPDSLFMCFRVKWDNDEFERMSPWDMEPVNSSRLPSEVGGAVEVLPEEISAILYQPRPEEWPDGDRDETCERILLGLEQIMSLSIAEPFLAPVDLNQYPTYAIVVEYPIDLQTIKGRFENRFYRRVTSAQFDVRYVATNAEKFNLPKSHIVKKARFVTELCLKVIREPCELDVLAEYHRMQANYESSESDGATAGPSAAPPPRPRRRRSKPAAAPPKARPADWRVECRELLETMWLCEDSTPFRQPVDLLEVPDYFQMIDTPMDLRTVKEDLLGGNYDSPLEFCKDIRLMFANSKNYNTNKRSRIYTMTVNLSNMFEARMRRVLANWKSGRRRQPAAKRGAPRGARPTARPSTRTNGIVPPAASSDDSDSEVDVVRLKKAPVKKPTSPRKAPGPSHVSNGAVPVRPVRGKKRVASESPSASSSGSEWDKPIASFRRRGGRDSEEDYDPGPSTSRCPPPTPPPPSASDSSDSDAPLRARPRARRRQLASDSDSAPKRPQRANGRKPARRRRNASQSSEGRGTRTGRRAKKAPRYCESSDSDSDRGQPANEDSSDESDDSKPSVTVSSRGRVRKLTARARALLKD